jgi:hypothetical protein
MRAILAFAITATFVLVFGPWWNHWTVADAGQKVATSIDPSAMTLTLNTAEMPTQQFVGP